MITELFHSVFNAYFNVLIWLKHWDRPFHISCKGALSSRSTRRLKWLLAHTVGPSASLACSRSRCEWLHCCAHSGVQLESLNWRTIWRRTKQKRGFIKILRLTERDLKSLTYSTSLNPTSSQCSTSSILKVLFLWDGLSLGQMKRLSQNVAQLLRGQKCHTHHWNVKNVRLARHLSLLFKMLAW